MSTTTALFTAVTGLKAQSDAMGVIGNNISNVNTNGFKAARTLFADLLSQNIGHNNSQVGVGTQIQKVENQFNPGSLQTTANVSDVALQGDNLFFAVTADPGTALTDPNNAKLTRAGSFHVNDVTVAVTGPPAVPVGKYLVNADGKFVLDSTGKSINFGDTAAWPLNPIPPGSTTQAVFNKISIIDSDGTIHAVDTNGVEMTPTTPVKIGVVRANVPSELQKSGANLYAPSLAAGVDTSYANGATPTMGAAEGVISNSLESSNVDMAAEMVNMIVTQRAYTANSKTITVSDQLTNDAIQMVR